MKCNKQRLKKFITTIFRRPSRIVGYFQRRFPAASLSTDKLRHVTRNSNIRLFCCGWEFRIQSWRFINFSDLSKSIYGFFVLKRSRIIPVNRFLIVMEVISKYFSYCRLTRPGLGHSSLSLSVPIYHTEILNLHLKVLLRWSATTLPIKT